MVLLCSCLLHVVSPSTREGCRDLWAVIQERNSGIIYLNYLCICIIGRGENRLPELYFSLITDFLLYILSYPLGDILGTSSFQVMEVQSFQILRSPIRAELKFLLHIQFKASLLPRV